MSITQKIFLFRSCTLRSKRLKLYRRVYLSKAYRRLMPIIRKIVKVDTNSLRELELLRQMRNWRDAHIWYDRQDQERRIYPEYCEGLRKSHIFPALIDSEEFELYMRDRCLMIREAHREY